MSTKIQQLKKFSLITVIAYFGIFVFALLWEFARLLWHIAHHTVFYLIN